MAYRYLDAFAGFIDESRKIELARILEEKLAQGEIRTREDLNRSLSEAIAKLDPTNGPTVQLELVETSFDDPAKISSKHYNEFVQDVRIDLAAVFKESNLTSDVIGRHEEVSKDFVRVMRTQIQDLESLIRSYQLSISNKQGYSAVIEENFNRNFGVQKNVEIADGALQLVQVPGFPRSFNSGSDVVNISVTRYPEENIYGGVLYGTSPVHDIEFDYNDTVSPKRRRKRTAIRPTKNMLRSGTIYGSWVEIALTDKPIIQTIDGQTYTGFVAVLVINYSHGVDINRIVVDGYSNYDLFIPRVRAKYRGRGNYTLVTTRNARSETIPVSGHGTGKVVLSNFDTLDKTTSLELMFYQPNNSIQRFILDKSQLYDNQIWDEIFAREYEDLTFGHQRAEDGIISTHAHRPIQQRDVLEQSTLDSAIEHLDSAQGVSAMIKTAKDVLNLSNEEVAQLSVALTGLGDDAISQEVALPELTEYSKYEYILGAYSVIPENASYTDASGVFLSHKGETGYDTALSVATEVALEADHIIPSGTTIEYDVLDAEGRMQTPIVPVDTTAVNEVIRASVLAADWINFETRFPVASGTLSMYLNHDAINPTILTQNDALSSRGSWFNASGFLGDANDLSVFTCSYEPEFNLNFFTARQSDGRVVDLIKELSPLSIEESSSDTGLTADGNVVTLSRYPFIDYSEILNTTTSPEFTYANFPYQNLVGKAVLRPHILPPRFEDLTGTNIVVDENVSNLRAFSTNAAAIRYLRFTDIPNQKYCISHFEKSAGGTTRSIYIARFTGTSWQIAFIVSWTGDVRPDGTEIYIADTVDPQYPLSTCQIAVDWNALWLNAPTPLPSTLMGQSTSAYIGALSSSEPDGTTWSLSAIHTISVLELYIAGQYIYIFAIEALPFTVANPAYTQFAMNLILDDVLNDVAWEELESSGWSFGDSVDNIHEFLGPIVLKVNGRRARDKTSYRQTEQRGLDSFQLENEYQFYTHDDRMYINYDFSQDPTAHIYVRYKYLTSGVKLRVIMNTNRFGPYGHSPILNSYRLKVRSRR